MSELAKTYPDDLDAATLFAESAMNLRPWQLWERDRKAAEGTEEIVATLEGVLRLYPNHIGANHLYIHAVEASPHPERAIGSANRLARLAPDSGHMVHMPAHIYMRVGEYSAAARNNWDAANVDRRYIERTGIQGMYPMMYYNHNLHFLAAAQAMRGRYADAKKVAYLLSARTAPASAMLPPLEFFVPTPTFVMVRFGKWNEILRTSAPVEKLVGSRGVWHFSRGMALAALGKPQQARVEYQKLQTVKSKIAEDAPWDLNLQHDVLQITTYVLDAKIALAEKIVRRRSTF